MSDSKITVAYGRLSHEDCLKEFDFSCSIYNQLGYIKSYASSMGLDIEKEYVDDGFSGANFDRPGFQELLNDIESGIIGTVITKDMSRLGRDFLETVYYISDYFPRKNVRFISINDKFDSNEEENYTQELMLGIKTIVNDRYVKDVSIKRKQVAESKINDGQFIGFIAPYGYKIKKIDNRRTLEIDEYAASIVKRIFSEIASGKTRMEVADDLNRDKIIPPVVYMNITPVKGKKYYYDWSDKVIYRILKNKTYTGKIVRRQSIKKDYHQKKREYIRIRDRETVNNCHPAIICDELFELANSKLRIVNKKEKNNYSGLFSDLIICGECGKPMTACRVVKENGNVKYHFECTRSVDRKLCSNRTIADSKLKTIVESTLKDLMDNYVDSNEVVNNAVKNVLQSERNNSKIANLEQTIEIHNKNIRNLYLQKVNGEISSDEFLERKKNEASLIEEANDILKKVIECQNIDLRRQEFLEKYNDFVNQTSLSNSSIRELIEKIVIYKDNTLKICFKFGLGEPKKIRLF